MRRKLLLYGALVVVAGVAGYLTLASSVSAQIARLESGDPLESQLAGDALSRMGTSAVGPLAKSARHPSAVVRAEALRALGRLAKRDRANNETVVPLLMEGLADGDAAVRAVASAYLGQIHQDPKRVVPGLAACTKDESALVRINCVNSLRLFEVSAAPAVSELVAATGDANPIARRMARIALRRWFPDTERPAVTLEADLTDAQARERLAAIGVSSIDGIALNSAAGTDDALAVALLLKTGVDPNAWDADNERTALMSAIHWANPEPARLLIEGGADVNARNREGESILTLAEKPGGKRREEIRRALVEAGAHR